MGSSAVLQPVAAPPQPEPHQPISGFWRRFFAFFIDVCLLAIVALTLGAFFFDAFAHLGGWGRFIGLLIMVPYFGIQNSALAGGQTLGKRLLGIRVVDAAGNPISLPRSLARSLIFLLPWSLNNAQLPFATGRLANVVLTIDGLIVFGLGFWILYLAVFNRGTRQSVHDLVARTYVVRRGPGTVVAPKVWKGHWIISGAIAASVVVAAVVLFYKLASMPVNQDMTRMAQLQQSLLATGRYQNVSVMKGTMYSNRGNYTYLQVNVLVLERGDQNQQCIQLAGDVLKAEPTALGTDKLDVKVVYGYDLGFAQASLGNRETRDLAGWREVIGSGAPPAAKP